MASWRIEEALLCLDRGVLEINLYLDVGTKNVFITRLQNFSLQMIPSKIPLGSRKS